MVLGQAQPQGLLDDSSQPDVLASQEPGGQLGVEQGGGPQAEGGQAGDVLVGSMKDPLGAVEGGGQLCQRTAGDRVDEEGADAFTPELDEVGVLSVAEA
jgi:hypothetical protein